MIIVVKKTYQGNGLSKLLILESETIAKSKGFTYCYCQASNFKTGKSLAKNCFTKLFEVDLKEF
jgi:GNAT superfamily N-acetyltransferase